MGRWTQKLMGYYWELILLVSAVLILLFSTSPLGANLEQTCFQGSRVSSRIAVHHRSFDGLTCRPKN